MPRKSKRWIDPKKSVTYEIVERSTDDVLSSTAGTSQNVLRVVQDQRPKKRRANPTGQVRQTEDGEMIIEETVAAPSSSGRPAKRGSIAQKKSIFEDDDEEDPKKGHSMFSDEEDGEDGDDFGDDGSSGIGSEDEIPDMHDDIDEESARHMRTAAPRESGWVARGGGAKPKAKEQFVRGGYDYGKHMKAFGDAPGGVFVSKDGKVTEITGEESGKGSKASSSRPQLLPEDLFASKPSKEAQKADAHDKMYGIMEAIDPDVQALLDSDNDDSGDEGDANPDNALDDDFVMQAIQPVDGEEELDVRAYLDRIIRTGRLPHEMEDPFGDDLEDIDDFLDSVPKGMKSTKSKPKTGAKASSGLDDIDDDFEVPKPKKKDARVRFQVNSDDGEEEEDEEYDSDMFEEDEEDDDEDLSDTERMARGIGRTIPGRAPLSSEEAARAMRKFEAAMADYDADELDPDDPAMRGKHDVNNFTDVLDAFLDDAVLLGLRSASSKDAVKRQEEKKAQQQAKKTCDDENSGDDGDASSEGSDAAAPARLGAKLSRLHISQDDGEEDEEDGVDSTEEMEVHFEGKEVPQWDVESYVSTYTNTENHPRMVHEAALNRRIQIGRGGVPTGVLQHERKKVAKAEKMRRQEQDEAYLASRKEAEKVNLGVARPKKETPEERRARKEALKVEKRANRETKKELKDSFTRESVRQQRQQAGTSRATIVHM